MLPMLKYELVEKKNWIKEDELLDCYAIGQCTPGIIAVNTATYVGYKKAGIAGGIFSTLGMITPSLVVITAVAAFLESFMDNVWLQHALMGVRGIVCALMLNTVINLAKKSLLGPATWILCIVVYFLALFAGVPTIILVLISACLGVLVQYLENRKAKKSKASQDDAEGGKN